MKTGVKEGVSHDDVALASKNLGKRPVRDFISTFNNLDSIANVKFNFNSNSSLSLNLLQ